MATCMPACLHAIGHIANRIAAAAAAAAWQRPPALPSAPPLRRTCWYSASPPSLAPARGGRATPAAANPAAYRCRPTPRAIALLPAWNLHKCCFGCRCARHMHELMMMTTLPYCASSRHRLHHHAGRSRQHLALLAVYCNIGRCPRCANCAPVPVPTLRCSPETEKRPGPLVPLTIPLLTAPAVHHIVEAHADSVQHHARRRHRHRHRDVHRADYQLWTQPRRQASGPAAAAAALLIVGGVAGDDDRGRRRICGVG